MTEPHDAGLKRFEAQEAKREARTEILEKIAANIFDMPEPKDYVDCVGWQCKICKERTGAWHGEGLERNVDCPWQRIQDLKKELGE